MTAPLYKRLAGMLRGDGRRAQLLRGGVGSLLLKAANALLAFLVAVVLARTLGPAGYGVYAFAFALMTLLAVPAKAGVPHLVVRETARARYGEQWSRMKGLWRWSARYILLFTAFVTIVFWFGIWVAEDWIEPGRRSTLLVAILLIPTMAFTMTFGAALRGIGHVVLGQVPGSVLRPSFLLLAIMLVAVLSLTETLSAPVAMALHVAASAGALAVAGLMLFRCRPVQLGHVAQLETDASAWRRAVMPLALVAGLQVINTQADIVVLGLFREDSEVGVYRAVVQLATLVIFGLAALNQVLHPHFASLFAKGEWQALQRLVTLSARLILAIAVVPALLFLLAGGSLLGWIFGAEYAVGALPLAILAVGQLANAAFGSVGALLNMTGHEDDTLRGMAIAIAVNLLLNLTLVPLYGAVGAAAATAISFFVWNAILRRFVRKRLGLESSGFMPSALRPKRRVI